MTFIAAKLKRFLSSHRVDYRLYCHSRAHSLKECVNKHNIPEKAFAKTVVLKDKKDYYVAVLPLHLEIDFIKLNRLLKKEVYIVNSNEADKLFYDCEPLSYPAVAAPYALSLVIDSQLLSNQIIYFEGGSHTSIIGIEKSEFCYLMSGATWGRFTQLAPKKYKSEKVKDDKNLLFRDFFEKQMNGLKWQAQLPEIVKKIMMLSKDIETTPKQLLDILNTELDIPLTLENYCNVNFQEKAPLINPALKKILEFNAVSHIVSDANFQVQSEIMGPLGINTLWLHAVRAAKLCSKIALDTSLSLKLDPFLCYTGGLLHNFGLLFIGQMFSPEYRLLNRWLMLHPNESIKKLESRLLGLGRAHQLIGCGHDEIGYWVMQHWGMPIEIQMMTKYHHQANYDGPCFAYVHLLRLVNAVLRQHQLGEGDILDAASACTHKSLGIDLNIVQMHFDKLLAEEVHESNLNVSLSKNML